MKRNEYTIEREPSRRDFLAVSALGLLGLASGAADLAQGEESQPDDPLLYVGTYTDGDRDDGIYLVRIDPRSGHLRRVGSVNAGANLVPTAMSPEPVRQHARPCLFLRGHRLEFR